MKDILCILNTQEITLKETCHLRFSDIYLVAEAQEMFCAKLVTVRESTEASPYGSQRLHLFLLYHLCLTWIYHCHPCNSKKGYT